MAEIPVLDEPLEVSAESGEVVITGPDGLSASLTPRAAQESARRLAAVAEQIAGPAQTYQKPLG